MHLFQAILRGEHTISGLRNKDLLHHLPEQSPTAISRLLKRLRVHGLIKRVGHTYKYYVTALGRAATTAGLKLNEIFLVPELADA